MGGEEREREEEEEGVHKDDLDNQYTPGYTVDSGRYGREGGRMVVNRGGRRRVGELEELTKRSRPVPGFPLASERTPEERMGDGRDRWGGG